MADPTPYIFDDKTKADLRRFTGFPPYMTGRLLGVERVLNDQWTDFEFRLNNYRPEEATIILGLLKEVKAAYSEVFASRANLKLTEIGIIKRNEAELAMRRREYRQLRLDLCAIMGVTAGPALRRETSGSRWGM